MSEGLDPKQPNHDQAMFAAKDLVVLWYPISRSTIYKILSSLPEPDRVVPLGLAHPKIDTTKRYKRRVHDVLYHEKGEGEVGVADAYASWWETVRRG